MHYASTRKAPLPVTLPCFVKSKYNRHLFKKHLPEFHGAPSHPGYIMIGAYCHANE